MGPREGMCPLALGGAPFHASRPSASFRERSGEEAQTVLRLPNSLELSWAGVCLSTRLHP